MFCFLNDSFSSLEKFSRHSIHLSYTIIFRKMELCKASLKENLFILHPRLSPALLAIQEKCASNLKDKLMAAIESSTTYTLEEFKRCHHVKLQLVMIINMILYVINKQLHIVYQVGIPSTFYDLLAVTS